MTPCQEAWAQSTVVSVTGLSKEDRIKLRELLAAAGGRSVPVLCPSYQHTTTSSCNSPRYIVKVPWQQPIGTRRYSPGLSRECTHLVAAPESSPSSSRKLALALQNRRTWRIHIVSPHWAPACATACKRLPEADFAAVPHFATQQQASVCLVSLLLQMHCAGSA